MKKITTGPLKAIYDDEFENIFAGISMEDFHQLGFAYGDSISFRLSNGTTVEDIPYYSGYYSGVEELMLCGYQGDPYVKVARNCGNPTWHEFDLDETATIEISLYEKGKYLTIQNLFSLKYSNSISDYRSTETFANFRELTGGFIKPHSFYRSASPCDNLHNRAKYANDLAQAHGIQCVLNLSNSKQKYEGFVAKEDFVSTYYDSLYQNNNVLLLLLNVNYRADDFKQKVANGFLEMVKRNAPVLIHCAEGKDRTGFVCATIMSLAGATYKDIITDYMETYRCYYHITKETEPEKYQAILENIYDFLYSMTQTSRDVPIDQLDLYNGAIQYLKQGGLDDTQIASILHFIRI